VKKDPRVTPANRGHKEKLECKEPKDLKGIPAKQELMVLTVQWDRKESRVFRDLRDPKGIPENKAFRARKVKKARLELPDPRGIPENKGLKEKKERKENRAEMV
jgi:hypothetical protein